MAEMAPEKVVAVNKASSGGAKENPANGPPGSKNSSDSGKRGPKFRLDVFRSLPNSTEADIPGKRGEEREKPPEHIQFSEHTWDGMETFLQRWISNKAEEYRTNRKVFNADRDGAQLFKLLGGQGNYDSHEVRSEAIDRNIGRILRTPEGWMKAEALLEKETADAAFVLGLTVSAELSKKDVDPQELLKLYPNPDDIQGRNKLTRGAKRVGRFAKQHKKLAGLVIGAASGQLGERAVTEPGRHDIYEAAKWIATHLHDIPHGPSTVSTVAGGALGLAVGWYMQRNEGEGEDKGFAFKATADALRAIQSDPSRAAAIEARTGIRIGDFRINEDTQQIETVSNTQSLANLTDVMDGIASNLQTRSHFLDDLHVPPSLRDAMPELFILQNEPGQYERTGLKIHNDVLREYQKRLRKAQDEREPKANPTDAEKRAALLVDEIGREPGDPLRGRGYPPDIQIPDFRQSRLLPDEKRYKLDRWGQASAGTGLQILEDRSSKWYGKTDETTIRLLDSDQIEINGETGSRRLRDRVRGRGPEVPLRPRLKTNGEQLTRPHPDPAKAGAGEVVNVYEYKVPRLKENTTIAMDRIFYVDANGNRKLLSKVKSIDPTSGNDVYDKGVAESEVVANSFYIPEDGSEPIPFSLIRDQGVRRNILTGPATGDFVYELRKGAHAVVEIDERMLTAEDKSGTRRHLSQIDFEDDNVEKVRRDIALQTPVGEDALLYGRVEPTYVPENWQRIFPPEITLERFIVMSRDKDGSGLFFDVPLNNGVTWRELQEYFNGDQLPPGREALIASVFPEKTMLIGDLYPVDDMQFQATDKEGRRPMDEGFGIDPSRGISPELDALLDYLDSLPDAPDMSNLAAPPNGKDKWGQGPDSAYFCRGDGKHFEFPPGTQLDITVDLDFIETDKWGQSRTRPDGRLNPFFLKEEEIEETVDRLKILRQAQELVWANWTEGLIKRLREYPQQSVTLVEIKLKERRHEEGAEPGRVRAERIKEISKAKDHLTDLQKEFGKRIAYIDQYDQEREQRDTLRRELQEVIIASFASTQADRENPKELKKRISEFQGGRGRLTIIVDGASKELKSKSERRQKVLDDYQALLDDIDSWEPETTTQTVNGNIIQSTETREVLRRKQKDARREAAEIRERTLEQVDREFSDDAARVAAIAAELDTKLEPLEAQDKLIAPKAEAKALRHKVLYSRVQSRNDAWEVLNSEGMRTLLRRGDVEAIREAIHKLHEEGKTFAWDEHDDEDITKLEVVEYAMVLAKATEDTDDADIVRDFIQHPVLPIIERAGFTYEMLEEMPLEELQDRIVRLNLPLNGGAATINAQIVAEARESVIDYADRMTRATRALHEEFGVKLGRIDRQIKDIDLEAEEKQIQATLDLMKRQEKIFGMVADMMADPDKYLPTRVVREADPARFIEEQRSLVLLSDLTETQLERKYGAKDSKERTYKSPARVKYEEDAAKARDAALAAAEALPADIDKEIAKGRANDAYDAKMKDNEHATPEAWYTILQTLYDYQGRSDREEYFETISQDLPPDRLANIIKEVSLSGIITEQVVGDTTNDILLKFYNDIREGNITQGDVREILAAIIDHQRGRVEAMA